MNRHVIAANRKHGRLEAVLSMIGSKQTRHAHNIKLLNPATGETIGEFVMAGSKRNPLSCGAVAWFEFDDKQIQPVFCDIDGNPIADEQSKIAPESYIAEDVCTLKTVPQPTRILKIKEQLDIYDIEGV